MNALNLNLEFCCTCLKVGSEGDKFLSLGFTPPEDISYKNKLKCCVPEMGLENPEDCHLCKPCSVSLETAYMFRSMCLRTETKLEEFRISQRENAKTTQRNIKLEMLEAICSEEILIEPEEKFSVGMSTEFEELQASVPEEETYLIDMSVDSYEDVNEVITDPLVDVPVSKQAAKKRDKKIDTVKKELGNLLTESLENLDKTDANPKVLSETNILHSLNAEIDKINSRRKNPEPPIKDTKKDLSKLTQKTKTDTEIVMIACKTIPELQNCSFESLQCRVSLNRIAVTELPVKITDAPGTSSKAQTVHNKTLENSPKSRFWCHVCKKDVHRRDRYNAHILKHSNIRGYRCKICYQGYFSQDALNKHKKNCNPNTSNNLSPVAISPEHVVKQKTTKHQTNTNIVRVKIEKPHRFKVVDPPVVVRKSQRKQTISKRFCNLSDRVFRCDLCDYQAYKKQNYQLHMLKHTSSKKFSCELCDKKYFEQWELKRHIRIKHSSVNKTPSGSGKVQKVMKRKSIEKPVAVKIKIEEDYSEDESLNMAAFLEPEITLTTINQEPVVTPVIQSIQSLATTIQEEEVDMLFMCKTCKISFKSRDLLFLHTQTHEWNHKCEVCNLEFNTENEALKHANLHNVKPKPRKLSLLVEVPPKLPPKKKKRKFFCTVCNLEFACRDHANVHTGAKPYECKHCGKHFAAYSTLRKHRLTHTRDLDNSQSSNKAAKQDASTQQKVYYCEICKREFPKKEQIYSHNCQNASGESVYRCQICKNAYIGRTALIEHMGLHVNQN